MSDSTRLRNIKTVHTIVWAAFAAAILAIPVFAWAEMYRPVAWLTSLVLIEVLVLALNQWQCPLTAVAARHTSDRRANFDIYLPEWLARHNKAIFGVIFVLGQVFVLLRWRGWIN